VVVLGRRLDDWLNPIAVRELRQAVQGKALAAMLIFFLAVEVVALGGALVKNDLLAPKTGVNLAPVGRQLFSFLYGILLFTSLLFVPLYTGIRMRLERSDTNLDLLFVTTLKPAAIIGGKLVSGLVLTLLLFTTCLPFMAFTYFLRGVDLPSVLIVLVFGFLAAATSIQLAILAASVPGSRIFQVGTGIVGLGLIIFMLIYSIVGSVLMIESGVGSLIGTGRFWGIAASVLGLDLLAIAAGFVLSTAAVMPLAANRALPIRVTFTAVWLLSGLAAALWARSVNEPEIVGVWMGFALAVLLLSFLGALSERETLGPRVRRTIPRNPFGRMAAFLFYSGQAGGVTWSLALTGLTLAAGTVAAAIFGTTKSTKLAAELVPTLLAIAFYTIFYGGLAAFARRRFLARRVGTGHTWALALFLMMLGAIVPILVAILVFRVHRTQPSLFPWQALNTFATLDAAHRPVYLLVSAWLAAATVVLALGWYRRGLSAFRRAD